MENVQIRKEKDEEMKKAYGKWSKESRHLRYTTLKIRPKNFRRQSSLITQAEFLFY